jgi:hypothetical protein
MEFCHSQILSFLNSVNSDQPANYQYLGIYFALQAFYIYSMKQLTYLMLSLWLPFNGVYAQPDTSGTSLPFFYLPFDGKRYCSEKVFLIDTKEKFDQALVECVVDTTADVNFSKHVVLYETSIGDCHATFEHKVIRNHKTKTIYLIEYDHYGGCRAARFAEHWIVIPKPPKDYQFKRLEVLVDRNGDKRILN